MLLESLSGNVTTSLEDGHEAGAWEAPLASLLNTLTTLVAGLAAMVLSQLLLLALWKWCANRRYYAWQRLKLMKANAALGAQAAMDQMRRKSLAAASPPAATRYSADDIDSLASLPGVQHRPTADGRMSAAKLLMTAEDEMAKASAISTSRAAETGALADILQMKKELSSERMSWRAPSGVESQSEEERARQQSRRERLERRRASLDAGGVEASKERAGRVVYAEERRQAAATVIQAHARGQIARRDLAPLTQVSAATRRRTSATKLTSSHEYLSEPGVEPAPPATGAGQRPERRPARLSGKTSERAADDGAAQTRRVDDSCSGQSQPIRSLSKEEQERRARLDRRKNELNEGERAREQSSKERAGRVVYTEERKKAAATLIQARVRGQAARRKLVVKFTAVRVTAMLTPRKSKALSPPPSPPAEFTPVGPSSPLPTTSSLPAPKRGSAADLISRKSSRSSSASAEASASERDEKSGRRRGPWRTWCCRRKKKPKFFPFPAFCRWPTLPVFVGLCCMTGIMKNAITLLAIGGVPLEANALAVGSLCLAGALMLLLYAQLIVFSRRHRRAMWKPEKPAVTAYEVADPALRLASTVRRRILTSSVVHASGRISRRSSRRMESKPALNRNRGGFGASDEMETAEPARTERLLARPFVLFPRVGADALESIAITVLFKCRGDRAHAMGYHLTKLLAQLTIVALASSGAAFEFGSFAANFLVCTTLAIQASVAAWIVCACPSVDRIDNLVNALSWCLESLCTMLLVMVLYVPSANLDGIALLLSLFAVALPILKLAYEALFAPIGNLLLQCIDGKRSANPFNKRARLWMFRLVLTLVQKFVCMGCGGGGGGGSDDLDMGAVNKASSGTGIADAATAYEGADVEVEAEAPEAEMEGAEGAEGTEAVEDGAGIEEDDGRRRARRVFGGTWTAMMLGRGRGGLAPTAEQLQNRQPRTSGRTAAPSAASAAAAPTGAWGTGSDVEA